MKTRCFRLPWLIVISMVLANTAFLSSRTSAESSLQSVGHYDVLENDFVYAVVDGLELRAHSYRPDSKSVLPAIIDVHGGAWNLYDRMAGDLYNKALASAGLFVLAIDFRQGPAYQHPAGSADTAAAVRFLRHHHTGLNIDPDSIGLVCSSSGGHLALLAGLIPNSKQHQGTSIVSVLDQREGKREAVSADTIDASINYIIALWPVSDPFYRYQYAQQIDRKPLIDYHDAYFGSGATMKAASIPRLLTDGEAIQPLPAIMVVQPGADANIPREMTFKLLEAIQNKNGELDYYFYPSMPHAFAHRPSVATDDCIEAMVSFINRQLAAK